MMRLAVIILCWVMFGGMSTIQAAEKAQTDISAKKIVINIPNRSLTLYVDGKKAYMFPVGIGKPDSKTPLGVYSIVCKEKNPVWIDPKDTAVNVASGPDNPLGYRWMQLKGTYGIHGTNKPESIGGYVSNGCVRMKEDDVEKLYELVPVGTPVEIIYSRIVIEKSPDKVITYYIYPDGYGYQPLDVEKVNKALSGFGVDRFVSDQSIADKISAADGQPTYIANVVKLLINGERIPALGVVKDGVVYLPAEPIAEQLKIDLQWDAAAELLKSPYGNAKGYVRKDALYLAAVDVTKLFNLERDWQEPELLKLNRLEKSAAPQPAGADQAKDAGVSAANGKTAAVPAGLDKTANKKQ